MHKMKNSLQPSEKLKNDLEVLQRERVAAEQQMKLDASELMETLRPGNLIKSFGRNLLHHPDLKSIAITAGLGTAGAVVLKNVVARKIVGSISRLMIPVIFSAIRKTNQEL